MRRSGARTDGGIETYAREIGMLDDGAAALAQERVDALTKPLGSLGRIESLAVWLSAVAGRIPERPYTRKAVIVGAADHGVCAEGVSAYPAEVTLQMLAAFSRGHAAINAFCRACGADLFVVDFGTSREPDVHPALLSYRVGSGTANFAYEPALEPAQVDAALAAGIAVFEDVMSRRSSGDPAACAGPGEDRAVHAHGDANAGRQPRNAYDVIALGDMGIGNTTSAAAIVAALTGMRIDDVIGRGTGVDDAGLERKAAAIRLGLDRLRDGDWRSVAREVGGFEIVGLAGVLLAAARNRVPIVLDGFIVSAAALLARAIAPSSRDYCVAAHVSHERGHRAALDALGLVPLFDLQLRLGEATGAALALPLIEAASRMICEMRTFAEAGVATRIE